MNFPTFEYAGFLVLVVALNWLLPTRHRPVLLVVASYVFYLTWSVGATAVLGIVTAVAWAGGLAIADNTGGRKLLLTATSTLSVIAGLLVFKLVATLTSSELTEGPAIQVFVPAGLSFFSLHAVSYLVDVHRGDTEARRSPIDVAAYLSFFPHLLAGPVLRSRPFIAEIHRTPRRPDRVQWAEAAELCLVGVFKKVVIADPLLTAILEDFQMGRMSAPHQIFLLAAMMVAGYCDVTSYIDIARGSAKFLGLDLPRNALYPLTRSSSYADFWRRWQLTLMMWFRDYVYRPVRGTGRDRRDLLALFCTFVALGIWHGVTLGWILWGITSGAIITIERALQSRRAARRRRQTVRARRARRRSALPKPPNHAVRLAISLALVMSTIPLVAGNDLAEIAGIYADFLRFDGELPQPEMLLFALLALVFVLILDRREERREARTGREDPPGLARAFAFGAMVTMIIVMAGPEAQSFVYQNF